MAASGDVALIPAYQPGEHLAPLVAELRRLDFEVVVVDDGSAAAAEPVFAAIAADVTLLRHDVNRGKGAALKTGLAVLAARSGVRTVVTADADGQHQADDIARVAGFARLNPGALALGVRDFATAPLRSRLGNTVSAWAFRAATGAKLVDTQTGLRACTPDLIPALLAVPGERFDYETTMLLELAQAGVALVAVPIATVYIDDNKSSHYRTLGDSWPIFKQFADYGLRRLRRR